MQDDFENFENPQPSEFNIPDESMPEEAVVRMPSNPDSSAGDTGAPADSPPQPEDSPPPHYPVDIAPYTETWPFWQNPLEERTYMDAPYGALELRSLTLQVEQACEYLRSAGFEAQRHELLHQFYTKGLPPIREYELLRHELEPQRRALEQRIEALREELKQTEEQFKAKLAEARLPLPYSQNQKAHKRHAETESAHQATPQLVEEVLQQAFANRQDICGEHGITPLKTTKVVFGHNWHRWAHSCWSYWRP